MLTNRVPRIPLKLRITRISFWEVTRDFGAVAYDEPKEIRVIRSSRVIRGILWHR